MILTARGERLAHAVRTAVRTVFWAVAATAFFAALSAIASLVQATTGGVS